MKLQSQISRIYGKKEYLKYWLVIPIVDIRKLGWENVKELDHRIEDNNIIIRKKKEKK